MRSGTLWKRHTLIGLLLIVVFLMAACSGVQPDSPEQAPAGDEENPSSDVATTGADGAPVAEQSTDSEGVTTESGLRYLEEIAGTGRAAAAGDKVTVHYTGMLDDGTVFDSSYDRGQPFQFVLGRGLVIPGWDEGIDLMATGGKARLIIPSELAYGAQGAGGVIPPNATLTFDVELVDVQDGPPGSPAAPTEVADDQLTITDSGLKYYDLEEGSGEAAEAGDQVAVHYTGWLLDGTKFDSSLDRDQPFVFGLGQNQVIVGWDEGVSGMKPGGKRQLVIPSDLGYGSRGAGAVIPPDATLVFEVELLEVR